MSRLAFPGINNKKRTRTASARSPLSETDSSDAEFAPRRIPSTGRKTAAKVEGKSSVSTTTEKNTKVATLRCCASSCPHTARTSETKKRLPSQHRASDRVSLNKDIFGEGADPAWAADLHFFPQRRRHTAPLKKTATATTATTTRTDHAPLLYAPRKTHLGTKSQLISSPEILPGSSRQRRGDIVEFNQDAPPGLERKPVPGPHRGGASTPPLTPRTTQARSPPTTTTAATSTPPTAAFPLQTSPKPVRSWLTPPSASLSMTYAEIIKGLVPSTTTTSTESTRTAGPSPRSSELVPTVMRPYSTLP